MSDCGSRDYWRPRAEVGGGSSHPCNSATQEFELRAMASTRRDSAESAAGACRARQFESRKTERKAPLTRRIRLRLPQRCSAAPLRPPSIAGVFRAERTCDGIINSNREDLVRPHSNLNSATRRFPTRQAFAKSMLRGRLQKCPLILGLMWAASTPRWQEGVWNGTDVMPDFAHAVRRQSADRSHRRRGAVRSRIGALRI